MNGQALSALAERKALLRARAELDRTRLSFALSEIRAVIAPPRDPRRMSGIRPAAAMFISVLAPAFGAPRVARWLRFTSFALTAYRIARNWRETR
jgi:hypothetical protein